MKDFLKSKKVKALILGIVSLILSEVLNLSPEIQKYILGIIGIYIGAQGISDGLSGGATSSKKNLA